MSTDGLTGSNGTGTNMMDRILNAGPAVTIQCAFFAFSWFLLQTEIERSKQDRDMYQRNIEAMTRIISENSANVGKMSSSVDKLVEEVRDIKRGKKE